MKPNLVIQLVLVALSLVLLVTTMLVPKKARYVDTVIDMEVAGERVTLRSAPPGSKPPAPREPAPESSTEQLEPEPAPVDEPTATPAAAESNYP